MTPLQDAALKRLAASVQFVVEEAKTELFDLGLDDRLSVGRLLCEASELAYFQGWTCPGPWPGAACPCKRRSKTTWRGGPRARSFTLRKDEQMRACDFPQANDLLMAAPGTEAEVEDLPVCRFAYGWNPDDGGQPVTASCWRLTWWERLKALWTGRVFLQVYGRTHPPLLLSTSLPSEIPNRTGKLPTNLRRGFNGPPQHVNCRCALPDDVGEDA